jgi:MFS family permease
MVNLKQCFNLIKKDKNFKKGFLTLIGGGILNFLIGAVYSISTLAVYEISYIKAKGGSIDIYHLTFYWPLEMFFQCIAAFISGTVYKKIGLHFTNIIGIIMLLLGYLLMYISKSLFQDLISVILSGVGTGIILYPSTTNAIEWFKNRNGLIVGIMESMISFGSFFFCLLGEKVINKYGVESNDVNNLYDYEIGKKFKDFLIILIFCIIVGSILSFFLMSEKKRSEKEEYYTFQKEINNINKIEQENKKENDNNVNNDDINKQKIQKDLIEEDNENKNNKEIKDNKEDNNNINNKKEELIDNQLNEEINQKIQNNNNNANKNDETVINKLRNNRHEEIPVQNENNNHNNNVNIESKKSKENNNQKVIRKLIKLSIKSKRLILFVIIVVLQIPVGSMAFALYREIGEYKKIDIKYLQLVGSFTFILECLSSFVFGVLCDYITIKNLLFFINGVGTIFGFLYCFTFKNGFIFFLVQILLSFSSGGYYPVKDFFLLKVFPKEIYIELNSYVSLLVATSINIWTSVSYFVLSLIENKDIGFWILFTSFGILSLIGFVLNFFTNEEEINLRERMK